MCQTTSLVTSPSALKLRQWLKFYEPEWEGTLFTRAGAGFAGQHTWISLGKHTSAREALALCSSQEEIPTAADSSLNLTAHARDKSDRAVSETFFFHQRAERNFPSVLKALF